MGVTLILLKLVYKKVILKLFQLRRDYNY